MEYKKPVLSDEVIQKNKEEFIGIFKKLIVPMYRGADKLLEWIEQSDFFVSPASTIYHMSCKGGLCQHSLNVYKRLVKLIEDEYGTDADIENILGVNKSGLALIGLCHDICKANCYTIEMRNVKDESGNWVKEPFYKYNPVYELGHGNKSVFIVQNFISLSLNEMSAINFHMGACGEPGSFGKDMTALKAMEDMEIVTWTVLADNLATFIDERREPK